MQQFLKRSAAILVVGVGFKVFEAPKLTFKFNSHCEDATVTNTLIIPPKIEKEEDDEWPIEKEECPFCRHFLESPCANQFKKWSKCVDKCKADNTDFVKVCEAFTKDLLDCTALNVEYFKVIPEADSESNDENEGSEKQ